jgi:nucleotide-binding universal stress UspA family protein
MKLLVAYDGSECSEAALDDLMHAGLPDEGEALVVSVAEVWLPPPQENESLQEYAKELQIHRQFFKGHEKGTKALGQAETLAHHARKRLIQILPNWKVSAEANYGSPAWEILTLSNKFEPDLIVVGSHGRSAVGRLVLGSISQKVLTEAKCSVRVARGKIRPDEEAGERIVIGFDGSAGAMAAVNAVAKRQWHGQSEVCLMAATDPLVPTTIGRFVQPVVNWVEEEKQNEKAWIEKLAEEAMQTLRNAGLATSIHIHTGNPKHILVEEAEKCRADVIFVGANTFGSAVERILIGSVSSAIAARAHCSVEVVRKQMTEQEFTG